MSSSNNRPLKVMLFTSEYPPDIVGGLGIHVTELSNGLARAGCQVTVLASASGESKIYHEPNLTVHLVSMKELLLDQMPGTSQQAASIINSQLVKYASDIISEPDGRPDVLHCHDWFYFAAAEQLRKSFKVPIVVTIHLLQHPIVRWWGETPTPDAVRVERMLCKGADLLVTVSESMKYLLKTTHGVRDSRIRVIHNGMAADSFTEANLSAEDAGRLRRTYAPAGEKIVIFAGRFSAQKGLAALFASAARVLAKYPNVRYLLVGGPPEWSAERVTQTAQTQYAQYAKIWASFDFLGFVPRERLAHLYQIADLALVPSVYEPFGYAAVEAMTSGVSVVATNVGGLSEIIKDGETGLLVPVNAGGRGTHSVDVEKLSAAQLSLLNDPALSERMGRAGRQFVMENFTLEKMSQATISAYQQAIDSSHAMN